MNVYRDKTADVSTVRQWAIPCIIGDSNLRDKPCSIELLNYERKNSLNNSSMQIEPIKDGLRKDIFLSRKP